MLLTAYSISSAVDLTPSCFIIRYLWKATVRGVSSSTFATSFIECPSASNCSTSRCRGVSSRVGLSLVVVKQGLDHAACHQRRHVGPSVHDLADRRAPARMRPIA